MMSNAEREGHQHTKRSRGRRASTRPCQRLDSLTVPRWRSSSQLMTVRQARLKLVKMNLREMNLHKHVKQARGRGVGSYETRSVKNVSGRRVSVVGGGGDIKKDEMVRWGKDEMRNGHDDVRHVSSMLRCRCFSASINDPTSAWQRQTRAAYAPRVRKVLQQRLLRWSSQ